MPSERTYSLRRAAGLCPYCGGQRDESGRIACKQCRDKEKRRDSKRYAEAVKARKCVLCGKPVDDFYVNCAACRAKRADYFHAYYATHRGKKRFPPEWKEVDE